MSAFYHSPTPWGYGSDVSENTCGLRDWISDDVGNIVVENAGSIDGPYIVEAVNSFEAHKAEIAAKDTEITRLREAMNVASDLLAERIYGSPARSPGHNARVVIERALNGGSDAP